MNPLIAIAVSLLPEMARTLIARGRGDTAGDKAAGADIVEAVAKAAGTDDPVAAQARLDADPAAATALKIRLAEIAAEAEAGARVADEAAADRRAAGHLAEMEALFAEEARRRRAETERVKLGLEDTRAARSAFAALAASGGPAAWGAPVVSGIVAGGFFIILLTLIALPGLPSLAANSAVLQIIHVAVGALAAAFATVVSFWLGSSQGSRAKDQIAIELGSRRDRAPAPESPGEPRGTPADEPAVARRPGEASNFETCVDIVLAHEGGYADHPSDPGGATRFGITQATLAAWRGGEIGKDEVRTLSEGEAREIYRVNYWNALNCDALAAGLDLVVFDFGVNAGPARSARLLQSLAGAHGDGVIGPATLAAATMIDVPEAIRRFSSLRLDYYRSLATWPTFGRGWLRRTRAVEREALRMAGAARKAG